MGAGRADRKNIRKMVEFPVKMRIISGAKCPSGAVVGIAGIATDFSVGGMGFDTLLPLSVGDLIQLEFSLPGETRVHHINATVRFAQKTKKSRQGKPLTNIGVKFKEIAAEELAHFTNYMSGTFLIY